MEPQGFPHHRGSNMPPHFFDEKHGALTRLRHDKRSKVKNFLLDSIMSGKMLAGTVIKKEKLT